MVLDPKLTMDEQWMVVKMMYGAQVDAGDFHHVRCGVYVRVCERVVAVVIGC
jgi:hypothetical protein